MEKESFDRVQHWGTVLVRNTEKKNLGVLILDDCKMSKQHDQAVGRANRILGCIAK